VPHEAEDPAYIKRRAIKDRWKSAATRVRTRVSSEL
jgi:hypothetical protein